MVERYSCLHRSSPPLCETVHLCHSSLPPTQRKCLLFFRWGGLVLAVPACMALTADYPDTSDTNLALLDLYKEFLFAEEPRLHHCHTRVSEAGGGYIGHPP